MFFLIFSRAPGLQLLIVWRSSANYACQFKFFVLTHIKNLQIAVHNKFHIVENRYFSLFYFHNYFWYVVFFKYIFKVLHTLIFILMSFDWGQVVWGGFNSCCVLISILLQFDEKIFGEFKDRGRGCGWPEIGRFKFVSNLDFWQVPQLTLLFFD